jgi:hypothetical protein
VIQTYGDDCKISLQLVEILASGDILLYKINRTRNAGNGQTFPPRNSVLHETIQQLVHETLPGKFAFEKHQLQDLTQQTDSITYWSHMSIRKRLRESLVIYVFKTRNKIKSRLNSKNSGYYSVKTTMWEAIILPCFWWTWNLVSC